MRNFRNIGFAVGVVMMLAALTACGSQRAELKTVDYVDLERFMGDWYVIANIPTFIEKGAHNAVETYALNADGTIDTTFVFRDDSFDGKRKEYNPKGFIRDEQSNAEWGMRFIWPIKADYRIVYLTPDYSHTVIGRNKRDYLWIMARTPQIPDSEYEAILKRVADMGYDTTEIRKVPQQWQ